MTVQPQVRFGPFDMGVAAIMNVMWGLNLIAVKMAVDLVEPLTAALLRQAIVTIVCLPVLKIMPGRMKPLLSLGVLSGAAFYIANNIGMAIATNVSALAIASQLGAPFSLILAIFLLGEKVHRTRIAGMALAFAGVVVLVFDPAVAKELPGMAMILVASAIWAVCAMIQRNLVGVPVLTIYAWVGLVGTLVLLPVVAVFEPAGFASIPSIPMATMGWLLFSAIGSTIIGQGAMSWLLQRHPVSTVVPMTLASPVIAVISGAAYFGTPLSPMMIAGGLIALTGVAIVTIRTARVGEAAA